MYKSQITRHPAREGGSFAIFARSLPQRPTKDAGKWQPVSIRSARATKNWLLKHPELRYFTKIPKMARSRVALQRAPPKRRESCLPDSDGGAFHQDDPPPGDTAA